MTSILIGSEISALGGLQIKFNFDNVVYEGFCLTPVRAFLGEQWIWEFD